MTARHCADYRNDVVLLYDICWRKTFARTGTFLAHSILTLGQIMVTVSNWIINAPVTVAATFADFSEASAV